MHLEAKVVCITASAGIWRRHQSRFSSRWLVGGVLCHVLRALAGRAIQDADHNRMSSAFGALLNTRVTLCYFKPGGNPAFRDSCSRKLANMVALAPCSADNPQQTHHRQRHAGRT